MHTTHPQPDKVLVLAASTRTGSINQALAHEIAIELERTEAVEVVDLIKYPMPLYSGDIEEQHGVPAAAAALADRLASAAVLVLVSPEYNGTFTPLLKNTIDWITRVDAAALAHLRVLVASASPGQGGGANGVAMVCTWLSNMGITTAEQTLSVGGASLATNGELLGVDDVELSQFIQQATRQTAGV